MKNTLFLITAIVIIFSQTRSKFIVHYEPVMVKPIVAEDTSETPVYKPVSGLTALEEVPDHTEWEIINKYEHKTLIATIYRGESSFGRNDVCRSRGGFNGFGFRENVSRLQTEGPVCYDSFETLIKDVNDWLDQYVDQGWSYNKINCWYVRGYAVENCDTSYKLN